MAEAIRTKNARGMKETLVRAMKNGIKVETIVNLKNKDEDTALILASRDGIRADVFKFLMEKSNRENKNKALIVVAGEAKNLDIAESLIQNGADVNAQDKYGNTALYYSVVNAWDDMAEYLLENGADVHIKNKATWTPIERARYMNEKTQDTEFGSLYENLEELLVFYQTKPVSLDDAEVCFKRSLIRGQNDMLEASIRYINDICKNKDGNFMYYTYLLESREMNRGTDSAKYHIDDKEKELLKSLFSELGYNIDMDNPQKNNDRTAVLILESQQREAKRIEEARNSFTR